ncbi:MAG: 6-carboxytetrahydropterin synthase [Methanolinea sp.]|jgi:6-pyruvoyltetrahydropterin/6-carboxytetrahydropterin synthase|nr:6-carboxytetrahydropterin synthase [Methanolinea sp.]
MISRIFKEVHFDASHRLLHYQGKCAFLHGHRWKVEVWMEGRVDEKTGILVDYNTIKSVIERFDHQVLLNQEDPLVSAIQAIQPVITTPGEPTSELLASFIADLLNEECARLGLQARVIRIRVWESPTCHAEVAYESQ